MIISVGTKIIVFDPSMKKIGPGTLVEVESFNSEGMDMFRVYRCKIKLETGEIVNGTNFWWMIDKKSIA